MKWLVMAGLGLVAVAVGAVALGGRADAVRGVTFSDPHATREQDELTAELQAAAQRSRAKLDIVAALVRGELSVDDAAAQFHRVLAADRVVMGRLRAEWPQASDRELVLRNMASFVRWQHKADPERVPAVLARLSVAIGQAAADPGPRATVVPVE